MLMKRYFIQLSYNGTAYHGWQVQANTVLTIQQVVNEMLSKLLNEPVSVMGCGRTDTGVHASDYYAHFDTSVNLLLDEPHWIFKFNNALPADIAVHKILKVRENANARFDAVSRTYQYVINRKKDPFRINSACFIYGDLNIEEMNKAAKVLFDYIDFSAFAKSNTQTGTNNCKLYKAEWREENELLIFTISADRFLRNMVRSIVGTSVMVGKGKINIQRFKEIIESKIRSNAGLSAHACGLYLTKVEYPQDYFING
ncbi:MAG: tRNA pseudouridine(38-40) synthase TruA [Bacteroidetes bacterium]|nr:tRNA pseudouridine(38-40) synthase TruA [Bacteroidota bacterium]